VELPRKSERRVASSLPLELVIESLMALALSLMALALKGERL
jgi:hypothetical protein